MNRTKPPEHQPLKPVAAAVKLALALLVVEKIKRRRRGNAQSHAEEKDG